MTCLHTLLHLNKEGMKHKANFLSIHIHTPPPPELGFRMTGQRGTEEVTVALAPGCLHVAQLSREAPPRPVFLIFNKIKWCQVISKNPPGTAILIVWAPPWGGEKCPSQTRCPSNGASKADCSLGKPLPSYGSTLLGSFENRYLFKRAAS